MSMAEHTDPVQIAPDPATLHTFHRQQLSAMLDGELSPDEAKFMLRRLEHDVDLARCWERWQLCGELLRGRGEGILPVDFAAKVAVAVRTPPARTQVNMTAPRRSQWRRWAGMGLAACVALAAVLVVMQPSDDRAPESVADADASSESPVLAAAAESVTVPIVAERPEAALPEPPLRELLAPSTAVPAPVLPRPWPRAGVGAGAFNVGYGHSLSAGPFQPRWAPPPSAFWPEADIQPPPAHSRSAQD